MKRKFKKTKLDDAVFLYDENREFLADRSTQLKDLAEIIYNIDYIQNKSKASSIFLYIISAIAIVATVIFPMTLVIHSLLQNLVQPFNIEYLFNVVGLILFTVLFSWMMYHIAKDFYENIKIDYLLDSADILEKICKEGSIKTAYIEDIARGEKAQTILITYRTEDEPLKFHEAVYSTSAILDLEEEDFILILRWREFTIPL